VEKEMKKVLIIFLTLILFLSFTKPRYGGQITLFLQEPLNLNPYESSFTDLPLFSLLWTNIIERIDGKISSAIFENWEYNRDKKSWRFIIKNGLLFSNASPVSSSDVKKSLELYLRSEQPGSKILSKIILGGEEFLSGASSSVRGISTPDPMELVINLKAHREDFLDLLSSPYIFLYNGSRNIFSGPYILSSWEKGESMNLKPNPYFGRGRVFLDGIKINFKRDSQNFDFISEEIKTSQLMEEYKGVSRNVFMFFNSQILNHNTRISLFFMLKNKLPKTDLFEPANSYMGTDFPIPLPQIPHSQSLILQQLKLNIAVEKGLEPLVPFLEKIFRDIRVEPEFVFVPSVQISRIFDSQYFQTIIFIPNPSPFYSKEKELIHYIEEYEVSKFDENFVTIKNLLSELESITDENKKMEILFYIQKNMIENAVILPLCRIKMKFYLNKRFEGLKIDDYGRPVFWGVRTTSPL
jgi:ABC-type transport system substrate-binding protein